MKLKRILFFLAFSWSASHCLAQSPYFVVGIGTYSETKKFADVMFPSKNFGAFGNGMGPELLAFFDNGGKDLPVHLRSAAIFFPRRTIHEASGDVNVQQLLVPVEAAVSRPLFNITKRWFIGISAKAGPQFISAMRTPAGSYAPVKTNAVKFGWVPVSGLPKAFHRTTGNISECSSSAEHE